MWNPFEQVVEVFGRDGLIKVSKESAISLMIPEKSKEFLVSIGLPKENILLCDFKPCEGKFLTINECARKKGITIEEDLPYKVIGNDGYMQICLLEKNNMGEVLAYDLKGELPIRYINCNIENFIGFLALYAKACDKYGDLSDQEMLKGAQEFEKQLQLLDSTAFKSDQTWWSLITHQMKTGLL